MKNIILLTSFFLLAISSSAQKTTFKITQNELSAKNIKENTFVENPFLDKFIGTWIWTGENKKIIFRFTKVDIDVKITSGPFIMQFLKGEIEYFVDNKKIALDPNKYAFVGSTNAAGQPVVFKLGSGNPFYQTRVDLIFKTNSLLELNLNQMHEGTSLKADEGYLFPKSMSLKRK
ncbi:DUF6705 family protein [Pedobacter fastidiosus]|uniref:DUF6705 domain-containing protein n=1 Tax=Pedobacter fastidiosus TaxID=2765361 RepID=A0ABR7KQD9_9SPHI|nr:DUF6705 family protein [Pedobacter fastidiosus]MBC6110301.1 hypothetical protein [Pedobacter fastidiosus]